MLAGGSSASNTDPCASEPAEGTEWLADGPHVMVMNAPELLALYPTGATPDATQPYVMSAGTPYADLMVPVQWDSASGQGRRQPPLLPGRRCHSIWLAVRDPGEWPKRSFGLARPAVSGNSASACQKGQPVNSSPKISGVVPAVSTPLLADGMPDLDRMAAHCRTLLADGATGLAIMGSTGEATSFSVAERQAILAGLIERGIAPELLAPGAGNCAVADTVALVRHGLAQGVTRFLLLPPFYYKNVSDAGLFAAYAEVVERVGDERLRIILYHFPAMSGVPIGQALVARLRYRYPETFVGMKDSSGEPSHSIAMIRENPGFSLLAGADQTMLTVLQNGGAGCITALTNLATPELAFIYQNHADPAQAAEVARVQARIGALRKMSASGIQLTNIKAMLARRYNAPEWLRARPPFIAAGPDQIRYVDESMTAIDRQFPFPKGMT